MTKEHQNYRDKLADIVSEAFEDNLGEAVIVGELERAKFYFLSSCLDEKKLEEQASN